MHMHSRPTEQISTAHRYTSGRHKRVHNSPTLQQPVLLLHGTQKMWGKKQFQGPRCASFGLSYFYPPAPVHRTRANAKNISAYLQISSTGFPWPWWSVAHALQGERRETHEVHSHHCGFPAAWLHTGSSLNKANCRRTGSLSRPPPCLIVSLSHCPRAQPSPGAKNKYLINSDIRANSCAFL